MTRWVRGNHDDRQIVTACVQGAKEGYCVTITAVDDGNVKISNASTSDLEGVIDIVSDESFCADLCQRFSNDFFKVRIVSEQKSESDIHGRFPG
jgi:hypothetical protein